MSEYVRANFKGTYKDNGDTQDYVTVAPMETDHATAFVNYWANVLAKTVTVNCTCIKNRISDDYQLVIITEPALDIGDDLHEAVLTDIDTVQDALETMSATIATANAAAETFAGTAGVNYVIGEV